MKLVMPQEIEVWYILPAIRKEIAKIMINDFNLSQRKAAKILGVTEAAISQYLHKKRAKNVDFDKNAMSLIKESTNKIVKNNKELLNELYKLSDYMKHSELLCQIHKTYDQSVPNSCDICFRSIVNNNNYYHQFNAHIR